MDNDTNNQEPRTATAGNSVVIDYTTGKNITDIGSMSAGKGGPKDREGLTFRQRQFAEAVGNEGLSYGKAYRQAYDTSGMSEETANRRAWDVANRPEVKAVVAKLIDKRAERSSHDAGRLKALIVDKLLQELERQDNKASDRLKAIELIGKLSHVGAFTEKTENTSVTLSADQVETRIQALLTKLSA